MNRLKELRCEKDLTQTELAEIFNISQQAVSHYEKEFRDIDSSLVKEFSNFFNVSTDYLLGVSDVRNTINDSNITVALHSDHEYDALPEEAKKEIANYIEYIKQKYKK